MEKRLCIIVNNVYVGILIYDEMEEHKPTDAPGVYMFMLNSQIVFTISKMDVDIKFYRKRDTDYVEITSK